MSKEFYLIFKTTEITEDEGCTIEIIEDNESENKAVSIEEPPISIARIENAAVQIGKDAFNSSLSVILSVYSGHCYVTH